MYVSGGQINVKLPEDVPDEGFAQFRVCVSSTCSAPLNMQFSTRTALLRLERPAYVHMPVWIAVDAPSPYSVSYPCGNWAWSFPGYEFEVRRNGQLLTPIPQPEPPAWAQTTQNPCRGPTARSALPLHLLYRFEEPGMYSVRFTAKTDSEIIYQSDWTDIQIEPFSEEKRAERLRSLEAQINGRNDDAVPSLVAWPDEKALAILLKIIPPNASLCVNYDCIRLFVGRSALQFFDDALLRREIPQDRLLQLCPSGSCKE